MADTTLPGLLDTGTHAARPAAGDVGSGALYSCTDHSLIYQSDGSSWTTWATLGTVGGGGGSELDYVQFTSPVAPTATSEATADVVVTGSSVAYDGSTIVVVEFFSPWARPQASAGADLSFWLYDGSSSIGRMGLTRCNVNGTNWWNPIHLSRRITPSNASHTYSIRASVSTGTASIQAGAGGSGAEMPGFIRISEV